MNRYSVSKATLGRLPGYLQYLRNLPESHGGTISATAIAKGLALGEVQVRKDLATVSGAGKPKIGYETPKLIRDIEAHLGYENLTNAVLVGAGKLGRALLDYDGFEDFGVQIIAGFDRNEQAIRIGNTAKEILAFELTKLVHGEEEAMKAQASAKALFMGGGDAEMPTTEIGAEQLTDGQIGILNLMVACGLAPSNKADVPAC